MKNERGITIIETTVILSVLFILAGVMSPIVSESVMTARAVKAKNDASMIAMGLVNFQKDIGGDALAIGAALAAAGQGMRLPEVLVTNGNAPVTEDGSDQDAFVLLSTPVQAQGRGNGNGNRSPRMQRQKWFEARREALDDHLMSNRRGYRFRQPGEYGGWNGPYLSAELKGDPWGNQYMVNSIWIDGGSTVADSQGRPRRAVFVVSAGGNGVIETPFEQPMTDARPYGDDIAVRVQ